MFLLANFGNSQPTVPMSTVKAVPMSTVTVVPMSTLRWWVY